jgi:hypothetical protein
MTKLTYSEGSSELSTIEDCNLHLETPLPDDSTDMTPLFQLDLKGRHMRYHPQLPLTTPQADLEKIIRKGKTPQEGTSTSKLGVSGKFHNLPSKTPITISIFPIIPFAGVSKDLNFRSFPTNFSSPCLVLEGERFVTLVSPKFVPWLIPRTLGDFPTPIFTTPPHVRVVSTKNSVPIRSETFLSNTQLFPFSPKSTILVSPVQTPSPPASPLAHIQMAGANPPRNMMDEILAARYAPMVLPYPMNSLPTTYNVKCMPQFIREGDVTVEEHLASFYRFAEIQAIENEDVWMRVFVQSLDGDARDWFKEFPPRSIDEIATLDDSFLRNWGSKKYLLYYITEFGALKREEGEYVLDFLKRFNKMYINIPVEFKPTKTSSKMTYPSAFDPDFCLLL